MVKSELLVNTVSPPLPLAKNTFIGVDPLVWPGCTVTLKATRRNEFWNTALVVMM